MQPPARHPAPRPCRAGFFPGKQGRRCNQPARPPRRRHGDTSSAWKTEASGSPTEACRLESTGAATEKKRSSRHTHISSQSLVEPQSPRTASSGPDNAATEWGDLCPQASQECRLGPPPPPTPHNHRQPGEGTRGPLSLCGHPDRKEGHLGREAVCRGQGEERRRGSL